MTACTEFDTLSLNMPPLPPVRQFIGLSWQRYTQHLGRFLEVSLWLLTPSLIQLALLFVLTMPSVTLSLGTIWSINIIVIRLLTLIITTWVSIRLIKLTLAHDPKEEGYIATHPHVGWKLFFPMVLINILFGLALFGGGIALVLPGIWLVVALSFSQFFLVDLDQRGLHALDASLAIVRHRWWPVVGRMLVAGLSFFVLSFLILTLISLILDTVFGASMSTEISQLTRGLIIDGNISVSALRAFGISDLRDTLLFSLTTPFLAIAQSILYKSLKETYRPEEQAA